MRPCIVALIALWSALAPALADAPRGAEREAMLKVIAQHARYMPVLGGGAISPPVMAAMRKVERHRYVPADQARHAYADRPLRIGHGQTISQPFIVALMTELTRPAADHRVLEIGTGSGYQAAVLAELVEQVYSIEIVPALADTAGEALRRFAPGNVTTRTGDGYHGWPDAAPFDAIVVTAAASHVPPPLVAQLRPGGRMVIPVGRPFAVQTLMLVEKDAAGEVRTRQLLPVRFVPLTGGH